MPASEKNPTGYWESMSLVSFNMRILAAVGSDMRCPVAFERGWEGDHRLGGLRAEAPVVVLHVFPTAPWVWKDPRNCLTFAFWRSVLDVDPVVVLVNRNPLEIDASSHRTGNWESKIYALALWERYLRQALGQTAGLPMFVTNYRDLLAAPVEWSERVGDFLSAASVSVERPRENDIRGFVDGALRHSTFTREAFFSDPEVSDAQRALYCALEQMEETPSGAATVPQLPYETPTTETLLAERRGDLQARDGVRCSRFRGPARRVYATVRRLGRGAA